MSVAEAAPLGSRGRSVPVPLLGEAPPPMLPMFWARRSDVASRARPPRRTLLAGRLQGALGAHRGRAAAHRAAGAVAADRDQHLPQ